MFCVYSLHRNAFQYTFSTPPAATPDSPDTSRSLRYTMWRWIDHPTVTTKQSSGCSKFFPAAKSHGSVLSSCLAHIHSKAICEVSTELQVSVLNHHDILTQQQATTWSWSYICKAAQKQRTDFLNLISDPKCYCTELSCPKFQQFLKLIEKIILDQSSKCRDDFPFQAYILGLTPLLLFVWCWKKSMSNLPRNSIITAMIFIT